MSQLVVHVVTAGDPTSDTLFFPQNTVANVGDVVQFEFKSGNHTASQSIFSSPCIQDESGFVSGFMPISSNSPVYTPSDLLFSFYFPLYVSLSVEIEYAAETQ
jgi:hypothetical protein